MPNADTISGSGTELVRDIVVVGASLGGIDALGRLVSRFPEGWRASVFIVQHSDPRFSSDLPGLLSRRGPLPATYAFHGEAIAPGHIYVAPPDNHLELRPGFLRVVRGPRENGHRPAVDALFRSAALAYGPRVVAALLTGYRDCGTAGLLSVKARGGLALIQDPAEAAAPEMPLSALAHVEADYVGTIAQLADRLGTLIGEPAPSLPAKSPPEAIEKLEGRAPGGGDSVTVCPLCHGRMTVAEVNGFGVYRCHVGHTFTSQALFDEQNAEVERALWSAVRALEEGAALGARVAERSQGGLKSRMAEKAAEQSRQANLIRDLLLTPG